MTVVTTTPEFSQPTPLGNAGANLIREAAAVMVDAHALAKAVASTQMIPKHFQGKPDECAAAMLYGASLGLDPMQSVRQIYVVHGQAALYARAMAALVMGAGHQVWTVASSDESVTVAAQRKGSNRAEQATWDIARAAKAKYTSNDKYKTDPQAMLYAKAVSEVCRKIAPDVLSGIYSVEELQMESVQSEVVSVQRHAGASSAADRMAAALGAKSEPEPPTDAITDRTRKQMFALFGERGIEDRDEQIRGIVHIIGRDIESRGELTEAEGLAVVAQLQAGAAS